MDHFIIELLSIREGWLEYNHWEKVQEIEWILMAEWYPYQEYLQ